MNSRIWIVLVTLSASAGFARGQIVADLDGLVETHPLGDAPLRHDAIATLPSGSLHLVQVRGRIERHYHAAHDELVFLQRGRGVLTLGETEYEVRAPAAMAIPRGTPHAFETSGDSPAVALVVYTPAFDGEDRIPLATGDAPRGTPFNDLVERTVAAIRSADAATLVKCMIGAPGTTREIEEAFRDPSALTALEAFERFPRVDGLPADGVDFWIEIESGTAEPALETRVRVRKVDGSWMIAELRSKPPEALPAGVLTPEPADLRAALEPRLADSFPSVTGLWSSARRARVYLEREGSVRLAVEFTRQRGQWTAKVEISPRD